jgi:uncharacterized protein (TIGR03437 family)
MSSRSERLLRLLANSAALVLFLVLAVPSRGQIQVLSITSSADFSTGLLQPGSLASIFCTGLQNISGLVVAQDYPYPRTLAGVNVSVNGIDAPLLAVANIGGGSYQQINLQIPWETKPGLAIDVSQQGMTAHFTTYQNSPWPVFFIDSSGYAIAQHASDYRPVTQSDPAKPGEWVVVYATNLGPVQNQPIDGYPAAPDVLAPIVPDYSPYFYYYGLAVGPSADFRSPKIQSNYIGMAPGSIVGQVNLLVPGSQLTGDLVFELIKIYNCGFFFVSGCGRGFTTEAASVPAKIPVAQ